MTAIMYVMVVLLTLNGDTINVSIDKNPVLFESRDECRSTATQLQEIADKDFDEKQGSKYFFICRPAVVTKEEF